MEEHHAPRREGDPPQADWTDRRGGGIDDGEEDERRKVWVMWGVGQRAVTIITVVVSSGVTMLLSYLLFGKP